MENTRTAPARSPEQRAAALVKANRVRVARARLKRRIKADPSYRVLETALAGDTTALGLEADELATMKVYELLIAAPALGRVKVNRVLRRSTTSPSKTVGGLTWRQREELTTELRYMLARRYDHNRNYPTREEAGVV